METSQKEANKVIAVSNEDFQRCGCPHCGDIFGYSNISGGGAANWNCNGCDQSCIILADGVTKSPMGVGDVYPEMQDHPRHDKPVDREKLVRERRESITANEMFDLNWWLALGFGGIFDSRMVSNHTSKSRNLPIMAGKYEGSNVVVSWFAQNYYFYFLGVEFVKPLCATLLHPIRTIFGDYALSGHVNTTLAPQLGNIDKAYHNATMIERFGADCGSGFKAALVIRYLQEVSQLNAEKILDICLRKTDYGSVEAIDGNAIDFDKLVRAIGLKRTGRNAPYDADLRLDPDSIFERIQIDWFDTSLDSSSVHVRLKEGCFLPQLPLEDIFVNPRDTALAQHLSEEVQPRKVGTYDEKLLGMIPVHVLSHWQRDQETFAGLNACRYPVSGVYHVLDPDTREFTFNVSNVLDAAMTAFFLTHVVDPVIKMVLVQPEEPQQD